MRQISKKDVTVALKDRWWSGLAAAVVLVGLYVGISIALSIKPGPAQVLVQYSAFSISGFGRGYWYHLWSYVGLALVIATSHVAVSLKLHQIKRRDLALALLWLTIGLLVVVLIFARSIIKAATLGVS